MMTLQAVRVNNGLTQKEAAKLFGISTDKYSALEQDNSDMAYSLIQKIPIIYGVLPNEIFFGKKSEFIRIKKEEREARDKEA